MTSLAITDGLLCLVAAAAVANSRLPMAFRMGSALLAVTAGLGVLRFSDLLPLPTLHGFFSAFSASSAFLLMAVSTIWTSSAGATRAKYASILLIVSGAVGFVMADLFELARFGLVVAVHPVCDRPARSEPATAGRLSPSADCGWRCAASLVPPAFAARQLGAVTLVPPGSPRFTGYFDSECRG